MSLPLAPLFLPLLCDLHQTAYFCDLRLSFLHPWDNRSDWWRACGGNVMSHFQSKQSAPSPVREAGPQAAGRQLERSALPHHGVFIAVCCEPLLFFGCIYIFTFSTVAHGSSQWLRSSGGGGWGESMQSSRKCRRWRRDRWLRTVPRDLRAQPGSLLSQLRHGSPGPCL